MHDACTLEDGDTSIVGWHAKARHRARQATPRAPPPIRFRIATPLRVPQPVPLFVADIEVAECVTELTLMERAILVSPNQQTPPQSASA